MRTTAEHFEPLGDGIEIFVCQDFHFTTDTILLADFANHKKNDKAVDLCTGCGTIPMLWMRKNPPKLVYGVEIFEQGADMLNRSAEHNNCADVVKGVCADLKELKGVIPFGAFDLVTCNPPYKLSGGGIKSEEKHELAARHEQNCTLEDVIAVGAKLLQFSGRLCICQRPERLTDAMNLMRKYDVEPKRLRLVQGKSSKAPKLFMLEGKRGAKAGNLVIMPTLIIENEDGTFTDEMNEIYGTYKDGAGSK